MCMRIKRYLINLTEIFQYQVLKSMLNSKFKLMKMSERCTSKTKANALS